MKDKHMSNLTAWEIVLSNKYGEDSVPFTKEKFMDADPSAWDITYWNENKLNESCTKQEFMTAKPGASNIVYWNENENNEPCTSQEFMTSEPDVWDIERWGMANELVGERK